VEKAGAFARDVRLADDLEPSEDAAGA